MTVVDYPTLLALSAPLFIWAVTIVTYKISERPYQGVRKEASKQLISMHSDTIIFPITSAQLTQLKIYAVCIALAEGLFSVFTALNFWQGLFSYPSNATVAAGFTLIAYELLTLGLVSPLFCSLQITLQRRMTQKSLIAYCFAPQPILRFFLFCTTLFYFLPLFEAVKLAVGLSGLQLDVVRFIIQLSAVIGIFPYFPIALIVIFNSRSVKARFSGMRTKEIIYQLEFLNSDGFSLTLLKCKPDDYLHSLIEVAKLTGNTEKADLISSYLLNRSLSTEGQLIEEGRYGNHIN